MDKFKTATDCNICGKELVKEEFLDSLPVWLLDAGIDDYRYCGQSHKRCYYENKKTGFYEIKLKRVTEQEDKEKAKKVKKMHVLYKATTTEELPRRGKRSLSQNRRIQGCSSQCLQQQTQDKTQDGGNTSCISQLERLRRASPDAGNVAGQKRSCSMEKYITFTMGNLRFIDSLAFFLSSLEAVVKPTQRKI